MKIAAVDPGKMTGYAWYNSRGDILRTFEEPWLAVVRRIDLEHDLIDVIVVERFIPRPGAYSFQPDAMYAIGVLHYLGTLYEKPVVLQSPADAKRFSTDAKLKRVGWHTPTKGGHANDALRHLLLYCVKNDVVKGETLLESSS